jgi:4-aminobutyrate aminotransferase
LHIGIEFAKQDPDLTPLAEECQAIRKEGMKRGCLFGLGGVRKQVLKIKPPLVITCEEADEVLSILADSLRAVFG